ncbi:MFS transporter [Mammaliicoccus sciuri]|uniref:MFS transporter n=1 Tax=Mammaliicoccus sciuri TaxID=1296 RepID=UPI001FB1F93B|nr:MFS transporter [Mammaliicoccus sciuri]MCJ1781970.1 MFS transporter [Mammaliicoccus sciuri]
MSKFVKTLLFTRFVSVLADSMSLVILSIIFAEKGGVQYLTFFWIIRLTMPSIIGLISGSIVDRTNHKYALIICELIKGICLLSFMFFLNNNEIYIFLITILFFSLSPFISASINPLITTFTNKSNRHKVNSYRATISSIAYILGPIIGAFLISIDIKYTFVFQFACFMSSVLLVSFISYNNHPNYRTFNKKGISFKILLNDIKSSLVYISKTQILKILLLCDCFFVSLSVSIDSYEIVYLKELFNVTDKEYSLIISYSGLSFVLAGILNAKCTNRLSVNFLFKIGLIISVISYILFTIAPDKLVIYISLFILGFGYTTLTSAINTIIQNEVSVEFQGRIWSLIDTLPQIATLVAILLCKLTIDSIGIKFTFNIIGGIMFISLFPLLLIKLPRRENI